MEHGALIFEYRGERITVGSSCHSHVFSPRHLCTPTLADRTHSEHSPNVLQSPSQDMWRSTADGPGANMLSVRGSPVVPKHQRIGTSGTTSGHKMLRKRGDNGGDAQRSHTPNEGGVGQFLSSNKLVSAPWSWRAAQNMNTQPQSADQSLQTLLVSTTDRLQAGTNVQDASAGRNVHPGSMDAGHRRERGRERWVSPLQEVLNVAQRERTRKEALELTSKADASASPELHRLLTPVAHSLGKRGSEAITDALPFRELPRVSGGGGREQGDRTGSPSNGCRQITPNTTSEGGRRCGMNTSHGPFTVREAATLPSLRLSSPFSSSPAQGAFNAKVNVAADFGDGCRAR